MKYTQKQLESLPQWAQEIITELESELRFRTDSIEENGKSNTSIRYLLKKAPLRQNATIEFTLNGGKITAYIKGETLHINTDTPITTVIIPNSANSFSVSFQK